MKMLWKLGTFNITFIYLPTTNFDQKTVSEAEPTEFRFLTNNMLILQNIFYSTCGDFINDYEGKKPPLVDFQSQLSWSKLFLKAI